MSISRVVGQSQRIFVRQFRTSSAAFSGGGGGRPGGRPVLSWKQRRELDGREKIATEVGEDSFELSDAGSFDELEQHFDLSTATMTDLSSVENFEEPEAMQAHAKQQLQEEKKAQVAALSGKRRQKGPRSFVVPALLFGSHKSEGFMIPNRKAPTKVRFSHKRVFGNKKLASSNASE